MHMGKALIDRIESFSNTVLVGPRAGCRDKNFNLEKFSSFLPNFNLDVLVSETFRPDMPVRLSIEGSFIKYRELIETSAEVLIRTESGDPALISNGKIQYLAGWPDEIALKNILLRMLKEEELPFTVMPEGVRERRNDGERFWFNYNCFEVEFNGFKIPAANFIRERL